MTAIAAGAGECALVTVIETKGSVPRHAGAKMLVSGGANVGGTVGGGRVEAQAIQAAQKCVAEKRSAFLSVEMLGSEALGDAMICGGTSRMLVEYVSDVAPYRAALEMLERGERVLLVKRLSGGQSGAGQSGAGVVVAISLLDEKSAAAGPKRSEVAARCLQSGKPHFSNAEGVFYDPLFPAEKLLVIGAGHVGRAVAAFARMLDFMITVADDRPELIAEARFPPGLSTLSGSYSDIVRGFPFDSATYVVIVTRGHGFDLECLRAVLARPYRYVGVIGSSRKIKLVLEQLKAEGFAREKIDSIHAPIGLDIEAETPAEIAAAIAGELVAVRRNAGARKSARPAG